MHMKSYLLISQSKILKVIPTLYLEMFYGVATSTPVVHFLSQENNSAKVY